MKIEVKPLLNTNWADFVRLMETDAQCSDCWCLNHREAPGCPTGLVAKERMQSLVSSGKAHGLLAYTNSECIAWIAIDPMTELVGHDCQSSGKENEWSIHCLFVKDGFRGKGISTQLVEAAIGFAKAKNAEWVSAFPIPAENRSNFPPNEAEFSGRFSTYEKLGFRVSDEPSEFYQRVEIHL